MRSNDRALWLVVAALAVYGSWAFFSIEADLAVRSQIERRIGAVIDSPWITAGNSLTEVIAFRNVKPESPAAKAGIQEGDIVVEDLWIGELCDRLNAPAGTQVVLRVIPGGDGPRLSERPERTVALLLP